MKPQSSAARAPTAHDDMRENATAAAEFLRGLANPNRLLLLCSLAERERSVSELETILDLRQPTVSQQLARLRADGLVSARREGRTVHYALASREAREVIALLYELFCAAPDSGADQRRESLDRAAE